MTPVQLDLCRTLPKAVYPLETRRTLDDLKIDRSRQRDPLPWGKILLTLIILIVLGFAGYAFATRKGTPEVKTFTVSEPATGGSSQTVLNASGYVTARRQATVSSKITGQVTEVDFDEGQTVTAGQVLARVDPSNIQTSLDYAEAQLAVASSAINETKTQYEQAERDLKRAKDLFTNKINTQAELDKAQSDADMLHARLDRQQAEITVAKRQIAIWKQQIEDAVIRSPFAGVIVSKSAQPGEIISPMSAGGGFTRTGIGTVVDMSSLEIEVDVNENYIQRVEPGQPVDAVLDAYPDWHIPCKVIAIIPTADRQKATVKVRIGFNKLDKRILPDMGVKVSFQNSANAPTQQAGVTVPKSAIRKDGQQDIIFMFNDNKAERRAVKIGSTRDDEVTILSNLKSGDKVITEAPATLKDGDAVKEAKP